MPTEAVLLELSVKHFALKMTLAAVLACGCKTAGQTTLHGRANASENAGKAPRSAADITTGCTDTSQVPGARASRAHCADESN